MGACSHGGKRERLGVQHRFPGGARPHETQLLLSDFDHIPLRQRKVSILFDCDNRYNKNIQLAAYRLAHKLRERGAVLW